MLRLGNCFPNSYLLQRYIVPLDAAVLSGGGSIRGVNRENCGGSAGSLQAALLHFRGIPSGGWHKAALEPYTWIIVTEEGTLPHTTLIPLQPPNVYSLYLSTHHSSLPFLQRLR